MEKIFLFSNGIDPLELQEIVTKINNELLADERMHYYLHHHFHKQISEQVLPKLQTTTADLQFILQPENVSQPVKIELVGNKKSKRVAAFSFDYQICADLL
jgi:hypothetical protein